MPKDQPKETRSSATRDPSSVSDDAELREDYKKGLPPKDRSEIDAFERDLRSDSGSLEKQANNREPRKADLSSSRERQRTQRRH